MAGWTCRPGEGVPAMCVSRGALATARPPVDWGLSSLAAPDREAVLNGEGSCCAGVAATLDAMFVVYCHCVSRVCRYVNGADPNRRRLSYKGMGDASVVAPLKHWHLLQGASLLRHLCKLSTHAGWQGDVAAKACNGPAAVQTTPPCTRACLIQTAQHKACVPNCPVLQVAPGCCTSCLTQWRSCSCCGAWLLPLAAPRMGRCRRPCRSVPQRLQRLGRSCQRSGQHGCCSGAQRDCSVTSYMVYVGESGCMSWQLPALPANHQRRSPVDAGPCQGMWLWADVCGGWFPAGGMMICWSHAHLAGWT